MEGFPFIMFALLLIGGLLIFVFGSGYYTIFLTNKSSTYKLGLTILFLVLTWLARKNVPFYELWPSLYAFFVASAANYLNWQLTPWILSALKISTNNLRGMALAKSVEAMVVVGAIITLIPLSGVELASIYLHPGAVLPGIAFGFLSLTVFSLLAVRQGKAMHIKRHTIIILLPWIATFVCANALMEELWFRGIFLQGFELALGPGAALLLTAIIFILAHIGAAYLSRAERIQFLVILFPLALAWGYGMQKTGSLLGSVISHAGADLLVLIGFIASLHGNANSIQE